METLGGKSCGRSYGGVLVRSLMRSLGERGVLGSAFREYRISKRAQSSEVLVKALCGSYGGLMGLHNRAPAPVVAQLGHPNCNPVGLLV